MTNAKCEMTNVKGARLKAQGIRERRKAQGTRCTAKQPDIR